MIQVPFSPPDIREEDIEEVIATLRSGWLTTGPKTKLFEQQLANYCGTKKCVCLNSATAGLELILRVLGIGPGDEVITSSYTYTASASVISHVGAKPILIDVEKGSYHIGKEQIDKAITTKTKAIIGIDIGGVMCDYDEIFKIVNKYKNTFTPNSELQKCIGRIAVIADGAHSFGAYYKGRLSGSVADFTSFSFHAVKNLVTGEGGAVTWRVTSEFNDEELYKQFMLLSLHGQSKDALQKVQLGAWEYDIKMLGYKCNMTDIMAALGCSQLKRYKEILNKREYIANMYDELLKGMKIDRLIHQYKTSKSSFHLYLVGIKDIDEDKRNLIIEEMAKRGIATNVHYKPLPMHTAYKDLGYSIKCYPNAYEMYKKEISLPIYTSLSDESIYYIVDMFKEVLVNIVGV